VQIGAFAKSPLSKLNSASRPATREEVEALGIKFKALGEAKWMPWLYVYFFINLHVQTFISGML
jgi:hypothetical protein